MQRVSLADHQSRYSNDGFYAFGPAGYGDFEWRNRSTVEDESQLPMQWQQSRRARYRLNNLAWIGPRLHHCAWVALTGSLASDITSTRDWLAQAPYCRFGRTSAEASRRARRLDHHRHCLYRDSLVLAHKHVCSTSSRLYAEDVCQRGTRTRAGMAFMFVVRAGQRAGDLGRDDGAEVLARSQRPHDSCAAAESPDVRAQL